MKKFKILTLFMCFAMIFSCSTKQGTGALIGTGAGALLGGIVGKLAGNTAIGAAFGGAVGAGAGAIIGKHMDKVAADAAKVDGAQVEEIEDVNGLKAVKVTFDSGILFATNKSELNTSSKNSLAKFANILRQNNQVNVNVYGHTDSTGNDGINMPLSQKRAESVSAYLKSCGVSTNQIVSVEGKGSSTPIASNETAEGKQQNRRVEVYMFASTDMINAANNGTLK